MYNTIRVYVSPERHFQINISALHTKILKYNLFNIKKLPTFSYIFCGSMHISVVLHLKYRPERQSLTGNSIIYKFVFRTFRIRNRSVEISAEHCFRRRRLPLFKINNQHRHHFLQFQ